jgi:exopolysaccharide biosynthesis polyprenyl glycosylphosphotransferase
MERSETIGQSRLREHTRPLSWYNLALPFSERRALLIVGDIAICVLVALAGFWVWRRFYPQFASDPWSIQTQTKWLVILSFVWLVLIGVNEGYDLKVAARAGRIVRVLLVSTLILAFLYLLAFFVWGRASWTILLTDSRVSTLPRISPALFIVIVPFLSLLWRLAYARLFTSASLRRRAIAVGGGRAGLALVHDIREAVPDYEIIGFIDDDPTKQSQLISGLPVLGDRENLVGVVQRTGVNEVILAITHEIHADLFQALMDCHEQGVEIRPMPTVYEELLGRVPVEHLGQKWFLAPMWTNSTMPTLFRAIKRLTDIALAALGLAVLTLFLPIIALANRLTSPGPLFYAQERIGRGGKVFCMYKLRSMIPDAEQEGEALWATKNDPRVTRVGRFLRRTRLDELPQLLNVLRGEMSIVGPRPERPEFVEELREQIPFYCTRLSVKPGVTGWAQIKYPYASSVQDALVKLQYDLFYIKRQSPLLDALIMLRTVKVMLAFRGT